MAMTCSKSWRTGPVGPRSQPARAAVQARGQGGDRPRRRPPKGLNASPGAAVGRAVLRGRRPGVGWRGEKVILAGGTTPDYHGMIRSQGIRRANSHAAVAAAATVRRRPDSHPARRQLVRSRTRRERRGRDGHRRHRRFGSLPAVELVDPRWPRPSRRHVPGRPGPEGVRGVHGARRDAASAGAPVAPTRPTGAGESHAGRGITGSRTSSGPGRGCRSKKWR
jgi:hypothetical protein